MVLEACVCYDLLAYQRSLLSGRPRVADSGGIMIVSVTPASMATVAYNLIGPTAQQTT
jgi:hypothetical protein